MAATKGKPRYGSLASGGGGVHGQGEGEGDRPVQGSLKSSIESGLPI